MPPLPVHFVRFVNAVHRRLVLARLLERIGIAVLLSSGLALVIAIVLLWHAHAAMLEVVASMITGVFAGCIWAIARRPSRLQAALEADRQLNLDDLLSSAWIVGRRQAPPDHWLSSLLAQADDRCAHASPSAVKLRRLGARSWGGIALAVALVLTFASFGPVPAPNQSAEAHRPVVATRIGFSDRAEQSVLDRSPAADHRPILLPDPDDANASTLGQNTAPAPSKAKAGAVDVPDSSDHASAASPDDGHGAGSARTKPPTAPTPTQGQQSATASQSNHNTGEATAGTGAPGAQTLRDDTTATGTVAGLTPSTNSAPPWKSANWPTDVDRARRALDAGQIPAAYRDLVRTYFAP